MGNVNMFKNDNRNFIEQIKVDASGKSKILGIKAFQTIIVISPNRLTEIVKAIKNKIPSNTPLKKPFIY